MKKVKQREGPGTLARQLQIGREVLFVLEAQWIHIIVIMIIIRKKEGDKDLFISHLSVKGLKKEQRLLPLKFSILLYNKDHILCFNLKSQGFFFGEGRTDKNTYLLFFFNFINFFFNTYCF